MSDFLKYNVSLYTQRFPGVFPMYKIIRFAIERLRLYQILKTHPYISYAELKTEMGDSPLKKLLDLDSADVTESRKIDYVGHWILKYAYSKKSGDFFINMELRWFKLRFNSMRHSERLNFARENLKLVSASDEEKQKYKLKGSWYKFRFAEAHCLLPKRMYPTYGGYIFIPEHKLSFVLIQKLKKALKIQMTKTTASGSLEHALSYFDLVLPFQPDPHHRLQLCDLDRKSKYFPLCMLIQLRTLRQTHHLKHYSRVQFGLFLKGLGLSIDDALTMWKEEFLKIMTEEQFAKKKYEYFFKHQYGLVGGKFEYEAQSCDAIIEGGASVGGVNGCPFQALPPQELRTKLQDEEMPESAVGEIINLAAEDKCKAACCKYFQYKYKNCPFPGAAVQHPIQYYNNGLIDIEDMFP